MATAANGITAVAAVLSSACTHWIIGICKPPMQLRFGLRPCIAAPCMQPLSLPSLKPTTRLPTPFAYPSVGKLRGGEL
jgi:hypothetical protein